MSHLYEVGLTKTTTAGPVPIMTILPGTPRAEIREIGIFISANGGASEIGLGRPAAVGTGAATGSLGQALDSSDAAAGTTLVTSFATTQPTAPTVPFRRIMLPAIVGSGVVWVWGQGELIATAAAPLVVWQFTSIITTYDMYIKFVE